MYYLRYRDDIETLEPDEQATIDGIIQGMTQQSEVVEKREQHAVRASHAKSSACVVGTLTIADDLPPELAQGLFAEPGSYDVAIRFAQGPGETLGDRVSTHRGMAIKVFGVEGEKLPGHDAPTQEFCPCHGAHLSIRYGERLPQRRKEDRRGDAHAGGRQERGIVDGAQLQQGAGPVRHRLRQGGFLRPSV
ncbi:hypothetical protein [Novosphingobium lindaniclasticum]|jgi:hypothetical protein|uniref:hypothetical protein n=1 Tax=Novosphingobium lindaniclasticum TaxID=1329895 RepID=UPI0024094F95|nr:hypothetical protein [Novosphingobium lindaniclasticum]